MKKLHLITTKYRGVFFAEIDPKTDVKHEADNTHVYDARNMRNVVKWDFTFDEKDEKLAGFLRLAAYGPDQKCRLTPPANCPILLDITGVWECSEAAIEAVNNYKYKG